MARQKIALIRGINVGKAKRVAMADLRALLEGLGCVDVKTLLNSGNVVFGSPPGGRSPTTSTLENALETELGVPARFTLLSAAEVKALRSENPLLDRATDHTKLLVSVPNRPADLKKLEPLANEDWKSEALALGKRVAYVWAPHGVLKSAVGQAVARALGDDVTTRNWATMLKIVALLD